MRKLSFHKNCGVRLCKAWYIPTSCKSVNTHHCACPHEHDKGIVNDQIPIKQGRLVARLTLKPSFSVRKSPAFRNVYVDTVHTKMRTRKGDCFPFISDIQSEERI